MNPLASNQNLSVYYTTSKRRRNKQKQSFVSIKDQKYRITEFNFGSGLKSVEKLEPIPNSLIAYFREYRKIGGRFLRPYDSGDISKINNIINGYNNSVKRLEDDYPSFLKSFNNVDKNFVIKVEASFKKLMISIENINDWFKLQENDPNFIEAGGANIETLRFVYNDINQKMRNIYSETIKFINLYSNLFQRIGRGADRDFIKDVDEIEVNWKFR